MRLIRSLNKIMKGTAGYMLKAELLTVSTVESGSLMMKAIPGKTLTITTGTSMMDLRQKFNRELWSSTDIPMKEYCVKKAERLILNEHDLSILFDHEIFESLVVSLTQVLVLV